MIKKLFCFIVFAFYAVSAFSYFEYGGMYFNVISSTNMTVEVTHGNKKYENAIYDIPNQVVYKGEYYYVTKIGSYAFSGCTALTTINFDKNTYVTTIADHAFSGCNAMNRISIPEKVTSIGNYAFSGCMKLMHVTIEDATSTLSLGSGAMNGSNYGLFADCDLRSFYWGRPLSYNTSYGYSPIANKTKLTEITIGPNVTNISAYMFYGNNAISSIELPSTVTSLGNHAFHGFTGLTSFTVPEHITSIGEYAFAGCTGLTSFTIPERITSIEASTFSGCTGLTSFTIGSDVTTIKDYAFANCTGFNSFTIGPKVTTIGNYVFSGCKGLTSFTIPNNVVSIGNYAFLGCTGIKKLKFEKGKEIDKVNLTLGYGSSQGEGCGLFYDCPLESIDLQRELSYKTSYYPNNTNWKNRSPFRDHPTLKKVTIGEDITYIYDYLLYQAKYLEEVNLPNTAETIGVCAFYGCESLKSIRIPATVTAFNNYAFAECTGFKSFTFGGNLTKVGNYAFSGCTGINTLTFEKVTDKDGKPLTLGYGSSKGEGYGLFYDCPLESIDLQRVLSYQTSYYPNNTNWKNRSPFREHPTLKKATIGEEVTYISDDLFINSRLLDDVTLPSTCVTIGEFAFEGCSSLTSIEIPASVKEFKKCAFEGCGFASFTIGSGVKTIGDYAFSSCSNLTSFTIPGTVNSIGNYSFWGCTGIKTIIFEKGTDVDRKPLSLGYGSSQGEGCGLFYDCPLESIDLQRELSYKTSYYPNNTNWKNRSPFRDHPTLKKVTIGGDVTCIYNYLFYQAKYMEEVNLPNTVTTIGVSSFYGCESITSMVIPQGMEKISDYAFCCCTKLTGLIFHPALKSIGNYAFQGCTSFNNFTIEETEETLTLGNGSSEGEKTGLFKDCPITSVFIGRNLSYNYSPLANMKTLTEARFGNPVTRVPNYIFQGDTELISVVFNRSCELQSVGKYAFDGCANLPTPQFPNTVTVFDEGAFKGCVSFTDFELPENLVTIGSNTFQDCTGLTKFSIPATTTSIGNYAFSGCAGVKLVDFTDGEGTLALGYGASKGKSYGLFSDCPLEELYLGRTVSYEVNSKGNFGYSPFYKQEALSSVTVGTKVKELPYCIFFGTAIQEIYIPSSVRSLHSSFANSCPNLKRIIILGATPPNVDTNNTLLTGSAEDSKFYVFFPDKYKSTKPWNNYADKIEECCYIASNLTYGGDNHLIAYKTDFPIVLENMETEAIDAGTYQKPIDVTYTTNGYTLKDILNYEYIIKKAAVTITAKPVSRYYGEENPVFKFDFDGFMNGEDEKVLTKDPVATTKANAKSPVGEYDITVSGAEAKNYTFEYGIGTLTVTKAPLTVSVGDYTKKQGEAIPVFTVIYDGFKNNETEKVLKAKPIVTTTATESSEPGEYDIVVSGGEADNYELSYENGTLTVVMADATVITAKSYTREYGEANPAFEYTVGGATLDGEPEIVCEATATSPAGDYPIIIKKGSVTNYNDAYVNGTLTITKAPLTVSVGDYTKKQGEAIPEFSISYEGFKNNETEEVLKSTPTAMTTATEASEPGKYDIVLIGGEADNYELVYSNGTLTVSEADAIVITAKSYTRVYGDDNPTFEFTSEGALLEGIPEIGCEASVTSPVGEYPIIIKKGSVTNYNDSYVYGTLTIIPDTLIVTVVDTVKEQGQENPLFKIVYEGWKNNDTEDVLIAKPVATTSATDDSPEGQYAIVVSGGEAQNYVFRYKEGVLTIMAPSGMAVVTSGRPFDVYTVTGRKVRHQVTSLKGLAPGVYIVEGQKVMVKQ